jgi:hypothetical protein
MLDFCWTIFKKVELRQEKVAKDRKRETAEMFDL